MQSFQASSASSSKLLAGSPDIAFFLRKFDSGEVMKPHEIFRLNAMAYFSTRNWENLHYRYLQGMLTENEWRAFRRNLKILYQGKLWQDYRRREKDIYTDVFRNGIEVILQKIPAGDTAGDDSVLCSIRSEQGLAR